MDPYISQLIRDSIDSVQKFSYKKYLNKITNMPLSSPNFYNILGHIINQIIGRFNLKLIYKSEFEELLNNRYNELSKWNSIGTFRLALENSENFGRVYRLFTDEDSKDIFNWLIKYRIAYALLGEDAGKIFPTKISRSMFLKKMDEIKVNILTGIISIRDFNFKSGILETFQVWILEQYNLEGKCEVSKGDYVIDGGAYRGESSLWFLSKGAERIYAFEPDYYNFSSLCYNIKRNKVSDKIIPICSVLGDKIGNSSLYTTGSGNSAVLDIGNKTVESITLDYFVERENLDRIDFIKLDVEGAELDVLKGASRVLKEFKPKMAISIYHRPDDILTIPEFISGILPNAAFYLSHKNYELTETILFVNPRIDKY